MCVVAINVTDIVNDGLQHAIVFSLYLIQVDLNIDLTDNWKFMYGPAQPQLVSKTFTITFPHNHPPIYYV